MNGESHIIELIKAFITVTYPKGTCTVSLGDKILTHSGGGTTTFTVNKKGAWTVKCSYSTIVRTSTVSISALNENKNISINYDFVAFANGAYRDIGQMNGMSKSGNNLTLTANSVSGFASAWASSNIAVDVTGYKTMRVTVTWSNQNPINYQYRRGHIGLTKSSYAGSRADADYTSGYSAVKVFSASGSGTFDINISSLSGAYYITAGTSSWSETGYRNSTTLTVSQIILLT